jgi:hypothetical protein
MSQIIHNIDIPDSGNGDQLRTAFDHQNQMNTELYDTKVDKVLGKDLSSNDYTITDKNKLDGIEEGAEVNVQANWNQNDDTQDDFIIGKPEQLFSSLGYFHHNDTATHITPLNFTANNKENLTNDALGAQTNLTQAPYGVTNVWNSTTNGFDFSELSIGDTIDIRIDLSLTTLSNNQKYSVFLKVGMGSLAEYDLLICDGIIKSTSSDNHIVGEVGFSLDYAEHISAPTIIYIISDHAGSLKVNGFYTKILRKGINIVTINSTSTIDNILENGDTATNKILNFESDSNTYKSSLSNEELKIEQGNLFSLLSTESVGSADTTGGEDYQKSIYLTANSINREVKTPTYTSNNEIIFENEDIPGGGGSFGQTKTIPKGTFTFAKTSDIPTPITIDATPTDGSSNAVSSNGVFDALALKQNAFYSLKVTTPSSYVTGTLSETEVLRVEIPANTFSDNDILKIPIATFTKVGSNGTFLFRIKLTTSTTMPSGLTGTVASSPTIGATSFYTNLQRSFILNGGNLKASLFGFGALTDYTSLGAAISTVAFDPTVTQYLYVSVTLSNTADQVRLEGIQLTNY